MIKCISFDFDRTLAFVTPLTHHLVPKLLLEKGITISVEDFTKKTVELRKNMPPHLIDPYKRFGSLPKEDRVKFIRDYNEARIDSLHLDLEKEELISLKSWIVEEICSQQRKVLYDDVVPITKKLKEKGFELYILSGNHSDGIIELLEESGIMNLFKGIITVDKYHTRKIDNFKILLQQSKFQPEEILHIGDDFDTDGYGARNCNINTIIIRRSQQLIFNENNNESNFPIITKLSELIDFIDNLSDK